MAPPPPEEFESVEVLVGKEVSVAPAPPKPAPMSLPSPVPKTVAVGTSVVEVRSDKDDCEEVVEKPNAKLVFE